MTLEEIKALTKGKLFDRDPDLGVSGLHIKVQNSGKKSFFFWYRTTKGIERRPKIGDFPALSLQQAREIARDLAIEVAKGNDPSLDRQNAKKEITVSKLFDLVWKKHWSKPRFERSGWGREAKKLYLKNIEPTFGNMKLSAVTITLVREWHEKFESVPFAGNRSLEVLSKMFSFAEERELRPLNSNPCGRVPSFPEKARKRFATQAEIAALGKIMKRDLEKHPAQVCFILLLAMTAARPIFLKNSRWDEMKRVLHNGEIFGVITKAGKSTNSTGDDETILIPPAMLSFLERHILDKSGTLTGIGVPLYYWQKIRAEAGCEDLWIRDWRRTFSSLSLSSGVSLDLIGEVLNHRSAQTTKIYGKAFQESKLEIVKKVSDRLEDFLLLQSPS